VVENNSIDVLSRDKKFLKNTAQWDLSLPVIVAIWEEKERDLSIVTPR